MADTKTLGPGKTFLFGPSSERTGFYTANPTDPGNYFWETDGSRSIYLWTGGAWLGPFTAADVGLGGGGGSSGVTGTLHQREFTVTSGAAATVLYLFDFGSDIITNVQIEIIRTSGVAPAIPQLATAVIKQSSAGVPVIGDFAAPANGTANGTRYPIMPTEQGSNARIIDPTTAIRHVGVKLEAAAGANYIIFCTAGS